MPCELKEEKILVVSFRCFVQHYLNYIAAKFSPEITHISRVESQGVR